MESYPTHWTARTPCFSTETSSPAYLAGSPYSRLQRSLSLILFASENNLESSEDRNTVLGSLSLYYLTPLSG